MPFKRISDTQIEIKEGGGCLSVFGLPFLVAGIFILLLAIGLVPIQNASKMGFWGRPLLVLMGLVFTAVGGWLVFGRTWIMIDTIQGSLWRNRGLLFPIQRKSFRLDTFKSVELGFEAGDSDSADTFSVILNSIDVSDNIRISGNIDYAKSLEQAKQLALFIKLPLEDTTSDHKTILKADQFDMPLGDRLRESGERDEWAVHPIAMRSKVEMTTGGLRIIIPREGFRWIMLLPGGVSAAIIFYFVPGLIEFFYRTHTSEPVQWVFVGFMLFLFGLLPLMSMISAIVNRLRGYIQIQVKGGEFQITEQHAWKRKTFTIAVADIIGLDYGTVQTRSERAVSEVQNRTKKDAVAFSTMKAQPLPGWVKALSRLAKSKGVTIKHRQGLYRFGAGLPDDEVKYLYSVVRQAFAGKQYRNE